MTTHLHRLAALLIAATLAPALAACGAPPGVVSARTAREAWAADLVATNRASRTLDISVVSKIEGGSAAAIDRVLLRLSRAAGRATLDGPRYYPVSLRLRSLDVPRQDGYPAVFLGTGQATPRPGTPAADTVCATDRVLLLFAKASPKARWKMHMEPVGPAGSVPKLAAADGAGELVGSSAGLRTPLGALPFQLAAALTVQAATGALTGGLTGSLFDAGHGCEATLIDLHARSVSDATNGLADRWAVTPDRSFGQVAFRTASGGALSLFTLSVTETTLPTGGYTAITQRHIPSQVYSYGAPTGTYAKERTAGLLEVAVYDPPRHAAAGPWTVVAGYAGDTTFSATPAASAG